MLYIIGLGLADEKDVSVKGLEVIRKAERVYLEAYTAVLLVDQKQLVSELEYNVFDAKRYKTHMLRYSRKATMAAQSSSPTAKWSNPNPTISSQMRTRKT